jgi:hypothetical protein
MDSLQKRMLWDFWVTYSRGSLIPHCSYAKDLTPMDVGSIMIIIGYCRPKDKWCDTNHVIWMILNQMDGHELAMELVDKY